MKSKQTIYQSVISGSVAGAVETVINHPLWAMKLRIQRGDSFTLNPQLLYRGFVPNISSAIPITAMQVGLNQGYKSIFLKDAVEISNSQRVAGAFLAGVGSAFVSCPTEMVMTWQHQMGENFQASVKHLVAVGGVRCLFSGLFATMMREGLFTVAFLAATPIFRAEIQPYISNYYAASLLAGIAAGVSASVISQSSDTLKTFQQVSCEQQALTLKHAAKKIYSSQGMRGFFRGGIPRGANMVSATIIMDMVNEHMNEVFCGGSSV